MSLLRKVQIDQTTPGTTDHVSPISGQNGVAGGAGAVGTTTQRTTLASDDPAVTALQVIDDWDETDRAKVNVVVGQAGITAGAGAVAANTPRVTHASDDPAVVALQLIDNCISGNEAQVDVVTAPVRSRTTDAMAVALQTDALMNSLTALTPKFAVIAATSSGNTDVVAAVTSKKIRVLAYNLLVSGAASVKFQSGASTDKTGSKALAANGGLVAGFNPLGWFETVSGEKLNINSSAAVTIGGELVYVEV